MILIVADSLLQRALQSNEQHGGPLYGRLLDGGDVAQVWGLEPAAGVYLGRWVYSELLAVEELAQPEPAEGEILMLISTTPYLQIRAFRSEDGQLCPMHGEVVRLHIDYGARLRGLFEVDQLAEVCIAVIGLGSGGSLVATQLARCGVGRMRLVDMDRLAVHNIARHVCGLRDIGRYKTRAVRDLLSDISPAIAVETVEADILERMDLLEQVVQGCDLVVAATDTEQSKLAINRVCWRLGVPAVYGAAYNRAFGGDIFRAIPPDGPCYTCFHAAVAEFFGPPPTAAPDFAIGYADPSQMPDLIAEPGLGMDIGVIGLLLARMALMTLLRGSETTLPDLPSDWLLFGNRAEWIFQKPLESLFIDIPKRRDCPTCNYETYTREQLGLTTKEAEQTAKDILAGLPDISE